MKWATIDKNWESFVPSAITRWPRLDEAELLSMDAKQEQLTTAVQTAYLLPRVEAEDQVQDWIDGEEPADVKMDAFRDNERISASGQNIADGEDTLSDDAAFGDDNLVETPIGRD